MSDKVITAGTHTWTRLARGIKSAQSAVERPHGPALDSPALLGAHELPAVCRDAVHVKPLRRAVIGNLEYRAHVVRHPDLDIRDRECTVPGDPHVGQPAKLAAPPPARPAPLPARRRPTDPP